ncbi:hypothetical protein GDO86_000119 [Hymenochirus boettgeri]|uniref:Lactosylceramide alpha-2,3-sialyltransferase n=1 Tax=Hymenochirus boettgeri TaxID=247094 RepID=A0A8T2KFF3_9PIPI|nr:hypothetical protein GDO86_000119 [Hymenochirus boettgeri]
MSLDPGTEMKRPSYKYFLRGVLKCLTLSVFVLFFLYICKVGLDLQTCDVGEVNHAHMKRAQMFARDVLQAQCRPDFAKNEMGRLFKDRYSKDLSCFVKRDDVLNDSMYKFRPPFGFRNNLDDLENLLEIMPEDSLPKGLESKNCKRCIVVGSGGILHGLDLGQSIDQFDIVIRLNNAPIQGFSTSVGNKTTIRMTYPEGAPFSEKEYIPNSLFVTVLFKNADFRWLQAVLKNESLSAWNRLFFWKRVPVKLPLSSTQFRILNPLIVKETAFDVLKYPEPQRKWLGWEKNVPTIGGGGGAYAVACDGSYSGNASL